ncbi:unnamed protein product [Schistocephalus solidus]|uniref:Uncharacterized protein n=1 Tax=Schistocephalus solidus TaxID=70667 RepID=A0A183TH05_SCHSO|nr:unnamed protein product [Schistocephalus solidus]
MSTVETVRFTEEIIQEELLNLKESTTPGPDAIPAKLLKEVASELAKPLALICQALFATGCSSYTKAFTWTPSATFASMQPVYPSATAPTSLAPMSNTTASMSASEDSSSTDAFTWTPSETVASMQPPSSTPLAPMSNATASTSVSEGTWM